MVNRQNGVFIFEDSDLDGSTVIVPKDQEGESLQGKANPEQESYDMSTDGEGHAYYIHIVNDLDVDVNWNVKESHFQDENLSEAVDVFDADVTVAAGEPDAYSGDSNGSYFGVKIDPASDPTSGKLKVIIQKASV